MNTFIAYGGAIVMVASVAALLWKAMRVIVEAGKAYPVLIELAKEFAPNEGTTLRDVIDRVETAAGVERAARVKADRAGDTLRDVVDRLETSSIEARIDRDKLWNRIEEIANTVEVYIVDRRPGGKRRSDPSAKHKKD